MIIYFSKGYFIESNSTGWHLKFNTGKFKTVKELSKPIIRRISSHTSPQNAIIALAELKIRKIDQHKLTLIIKEIHEIKKEILAETKIFNCKQWFKEESND